MLERIRKPEAKKRFLNGESIFMYASKVRVPSVWIQPCHMNTNGEELSIETFNKIITYFEYYNCNSELGRYTAFYVEK